jgi:RsiW-degrading membrane proteinase PrsW (M82 family)
MRQDKLSTIVVTTYLFIYTTLFHAEAPLKVLGVMFLISPFLVLWMAYSILKFGVFDSKELDNNEEWGYSDKNKDELGSF